VEEPRRGLTDSAEPLVERYDCAMLDLDGVVYVGGEAVPGVPELLEGARARGMKLAYVTNNAARTPESVARHLTELGVAAGASDVVTSAQAAAREVAKLVPAGSKVLVVGGEGLHEALLERRLQPVRSADDDPLAVVQGFSPTLGWAALAEGGYVLQRGVPWVASNLDITIPTARGIAPGNGTLVNALAAVASRRPDSVAGKPHRPLFDETVRRTSARMPIVVGDRLDTDIQGAVTCGADSLLVMTGVTDLQALCHAEIGQRPNYVAWTMGGLMTSHACPEPAPAGGRRLAGWTVQVHGDALVVVERGDSVDDGLRVAAMAAWDALGDHPNRRLDVSRLAPVWPSR
jgi:HAD superfamily hydrolase (TIGR01450 family)